MPATQLFVRSSNVIGNDNGRSDHCQFDARGEFEIWLNPEGRDVLVKELQGLSETNYHFHLGPRPIGEVQVSGRRIGQTISF